MMVDLGCGEGGWKKKFSKIIIIIFHGDTAPLGRAEPLGSPELKLSVKGIQRQRLKREAAACLCVWKRAFCKHESCLKAVLANPL